MGCYKTMSALRIGFLSCLKCRHASSTIMKNPITLSAFHKTSTKDQGSLESNNYKYQHFKKGKDHEKINSYSVEFEHNQRDTLFEGHIQTNSLQKVFLAAGSTVLCLKSPWRNDMISVMGEVTGHCSLRYMRSRMLEDPTGQQILCDQPRINSGTINLEAFAELPENTLGYHYYTYLKVNNVHPDDRQPVRFVDDAKLAYVMTRYRETHDLLHTLLGMPTNMIGEVVVKWVEGIQYLLPLGLLGGCFGALRLGPKHWNLYCDEHLWWALDVGRNANFLMNIYYEKLFNQPIASIRKEHNIPEPPVTPQLRNQHRR